ncbi:MAG: FkbM family methyltransferase [Candidatus Acidiferrales bacterium]
MKSTRRMPPVPTCKRMNGVLFEYDLADYRGTVQMYFGSYAPLVIEAIRKYLAPGGVFIDVGANIGYLSAIAAGLVGSGGEVHSFEPVPAYCERLQRLAELNPRYRIFPNACAAGERAGMCAIYVTREPGQNTMVPEYQRRAEVVSTLDVPVARLDDYIAEKRITRISLLKIDAEGFELPVLKGLERYFSSRRDRPPIICEIAPRAYSLIGQSLADLENYMGQFGYSSRDVVDGRTPINLRQIKQVEDVLFLAR